MSRVLLVGLVCCVLTVACNSDGPMPISETGTGSGGGDSGSGDEPDPDDPDPCTDQTCGEGEVCDPQTGECVCVEGTHACDGACVDDTSVDHCGQSCTPCPDDPNGTAVCEGGTCGLVCNDEFFACDDGCCLADTGVVALGDYVAPSIAVDAAGKPHVSFLANHYELMYAHLGDTGWTVTPIGEDGNEYSTAITIDPDGRPVIAYEANWTVRLARTDGASWTHETLYESAFGYGPAISARSVALDSGGGVHVLFQQENGGTLDAFIRHIWHDGAEWKYQTITESADNRYSLPALTIGSDDTLHVSWISYFDGGLHYAHQGAGDWETTFVPDTARCCGDSYVAVSSGGTPFFAFEGSDGSYTLADGDSQPWPLTPLHAQMELAGDLAFDSTDGLHYAVANDQAELIHGRPTDGGWEESTVATSVRSFMMVLDHFDRAHFVYTDDSALRYLRVDPP